MLKALSYACPTHCVMVSDTCNSTSLIASVIVDACNSLFSTNPYSRYSLHQSTELIRPIVPWHSYFEFHRQLQSTMQNFKYLQAVSEEAETPSVGLIYNDRGSVSSIGQPL